MELLMQPGVMAYPEFEWPFVLHMDASSGGFGAVRYQEQGGKLRVVGYGYRTFTHPEHNYLLHSGKFEFFKPTLKDLNLKPFSPKEIREAQESESALHYLLYNKTHGIKLSGSQLKDGHLTVTNLRRQWKKLEVDEHGILRWKTSST